MAALHPDMSWVVEYQPLIVELVQNCKDDAVCLIFIVRLIYREVTFQ